jgi:siroheme synthase (precorrin-2 oxidase/ferrochelatase)
MNGLAVEIMHSALLENQLINVIDKFDFCTIFICKISHTAPTIAIPDKYLTPPDHSHSR